MGLVASKLWHNNVSYKYTHTHTDNILFYKLNWTELNYLIQWMNEFGTLDGKGIQRPT